MKRYEHSGVAPETALQGPLAQGASSFTVVDGTGYPTGEVGTFFVSLDRGSASEEVVECVSRSGNTFTVNPGGRGASGTQDTTHAPGAVIEHGWTAQEADELNAAVVAQDAVIGQLNLTGGTDGTAFTPTVRAVSITGTPWPLGANTGRYKLMFGWLHGASRSVNAGNGPSFGVNQAQFITVPRAPVDGFVGSLGTFSYVTEAGDIRYSGDITFGYFGGSYARLNGASTSTFPTSNVWELLCNWHYPAAP